MNLNQFKHLEFYAGIDEAGRGPLAGPVVAAAVVLNPEQAIDGLADSKKLNANKRKEICIEIKRNAIAWGIGFSSASEIDKINIHQATLKAMQRAYEAMNYQVDNVFIDGLYCPTISSNCTAIVKGDQKILAISAASVLAKVTRDIEMVQHHHTLPQYGFDQHKGYPTVQHILALNKYGPCCLHRKSFKPVKECLDNSASNKSEEYILLKKD